MDLSSTPLFTWLMDMLRAIGSARTPFFDSVMSAVTVLGAEWLAVVVAVIFFYCISKKQGYKFLFLFCFGTLLNIVLKQIFMIPRPWVIDPSFQIVETARAAATGWSFPSGHTQNITVLCFGLAGALRKKWVGIAAAAVVLLVGFSRMYLGVHTLLDVVVALGTGVLTLLLTDLLFKRFGDIPSFPTVLLGITAGLMLVFLVVVMATDHTELRENDLGTAATMFGLTFGVVAGGIIERRFINFEVKAVWWVQLIKVALGLGVIMGVRAGLKPLFKLIYDDPIMNAPRYFLMTFCGMAVVPLVFGILNKLNRNSASGIPAKTSDC